MLCEKYGKYHHHHHIKIGLTYLLGPVIRVGPNSVITSDLEATQKILGIRSRYQRSNYYDEFRLDPVYPDIHSVTDGSLHTSLKIKMSAGASTLCPWIPAAH